MASEVFVATDSLRPDRNAVAIKRVALGLTKDATKAAAYAEKARDVAKRLRHPNVVEIRDVEADGRGVYLVMDYVPGETLARFVRGLRESGQPLPPSMAAYIVHEACTGLDAAHRAGIVHGHLTPYDVFIGYDGAVRVLDIGVAAAADGEIRLASDIELQYSAPEVCRGQSADRRSDVFSLGTILWEVLTGVPPFERATRAETFRAICDEVIAPPSALRRDANLPSHLSEIAMEALAREPERRCPDAGNLGQLLVGYVGPEARAELSRLLSLTFEKRKRDKGKLVACAARKAHSREYEGLDFTDDPLGFLHGADLDAKSPSGISAPSAGEVTTGPTVVVHGDPIPAPLALPPTPRAKPPRVPFFDDDEEARRRRLEPTYVAPRPAESSAATPAVKAKRRWSARVFVALGATFFAMIGVAVVLVVVRGKRDAHATTVAAAVPSTTVAVPQPSVSIAPTSASASASAAAEESSVLSIDTVPSHATISVNGEKKGKSPIEVTLPKSNEEVVIEIEHPGYVTIKERIVPNVNQRLKLNLVAIGGKTATKPASSNPYKKFE
jgi:serine/threonine protein kinase